MSVNVEAMVREGVNAFRAGKKEEARALLMLAVEKDQFNEQAWLWLSAVVDNPDDQRTCLENVLAINPNNERAKQGIAALSQPGASALPPPPPPAAPPPGTESTAAPFTSVEWGAPETSSPSANFRPGPEPDYDNWLQNLNLPASEARPANPMDAAAAAFSSPLDEEDDALFTNGPFSASTFDVDTQAPPSPPAQKTGSKGAAQSPPPTAPKDSSRSSGKASMVSATMPTVSPSEKSSFYDPESEQMDEQPPADEGDEMFSMIPKEIKATRLPGSKGSIQIVPLILFLVLLAANVFAVLRLVQAFSSSG